MKQAFKIFAVVLVAAAIANAQGHAAKSIKGIWKVAEIVTTGNVAANVSNPQPGYMMFGQKYYSVMYVASEKERPTYAGAAPTIEEKVAAFDSLLANAGTYELSSGILTIRPTVARNPGFTGGAFATYRVTADGKTIWLMIKNSEFSFRVGGKIVPLGGPSSETTIKLVRLE